MKLGKAQEKKNRKDFERGELEEVFLPDEAAMKMDLRNNEIASGFEAKTRNELLKKVLIAAKNGKLWKVKQNANGDFLDEESNVIPLESWSGKWENKRVLVPTDL